MHQTKFIDYALAVVFVYIILLVSCSSSSPTVVSGELKKWHPISLTFDGPLAEENGTPNPFRDYRLMVTFSHTSSGASVTVPGYFAADGKAGESGATSGQKWRVNFTPHETGEWTYSASFRTGQDVAINLDPGAGTASSFDGTTGSFDIDA